MSPLEAVQDLLSRASGDRINESDAQRLWRAANVGPDAMTAGLLRQLVRLLNMRSRLDLNALGTASMDAAILGTIAELNELGAHAQMRAICSRWRAA